MSSVFSSSTASTPLVRAQDVATLGLRLAVGREPAREGEFRVSAGRELAREPLTPAAGVQDDERLLLAIAAGVGRAPPVLSGQILAIVRDLQHAASLRHAC